MLKEACSVEAVKRLRAAGVDAESARRFVRAALQGDGPSESLDEFKTFGSIPRGGVIVDLVRRFTGLAWVVAWPDAGTVEIVEAVAGKHMWPRTRLPWSGILDAEAVQRALADEPSGRELFLDLTDVLRARSDHRPHVVLPVPRGVWAAVLALWIMASYLADQFHYFPVILLEGPPERGKTRLGKLLTFLAWRGMATPSPTPASLFRNAEYHCISMFIDVKDLPRMLQPGSDFENLISGASSAITRCRASGRTDRSAGG